MNDLPYHILSLTHLRQVDTGQQLDRVACQQEQLGTEDTAVADRVVPDTAVPDRAAAAVEDTVPGERMAVDKLVCLVPCRLRRRLPIRYGTPLYSVTTNNTEHSRHHVAGYNKVQRRLARSLQNSVLRAAGLRYLLVTCYL